LKIISSIYNWVNAQSITAELTYTHKMTMDRPHFDDQF